MGGTIQHHTKNAAGPDRLRGALHQRVWRRLRRDDDERGIDHRQQQVRVRQDRNRWRVDHHPIESVPGFVAGDTNKLIGSATTLPAVRTDNVGLT